MYAVLGTLSYICIWLLLDCRRKTGIASFGKIALEASGKPGMIAVDTSLTISQFGIVTSYIVFVNKVVATLCNVPPSVSTLAQTMIMMPLSFIRQLKYLAYPNLAADLIILSALIVIIVYNSKAIIATGPSPYVVAFRPQTCGLFIGTAVFSFEGIPLILPVRDSMQEPEHFLSVFTPVFILVVLLFISFGLLGYADFGHAVADTALDNLPSDALSGTVKISFCFALMCGMPLMFLPSAHIV